MLLSVDRLSISFNTFYGKVHVLDQVSFSVDKGEILAIVGESGSGKSVSAYSVLGLLDKNAAIENGKILFDEIDLTKLSKKEIRQYRGKKIGMVFQEPMTALNPTMRVEDQLLNVLKRHRNLPRKEAYPVMLDMLRDVHFDDPQLIAKKYPHELSGGMRQRIVIALAMAGLPELLIADEPTTALDVTIQGEVLSLIRELTKKYCTAVLLITHDLGVVKEVSDSVCVMYGGKIMEHGTTSEIFNNPTHPYTKALLRALPDRVDRGTRLQEIQGEIPSLISRPIGCIFSSRCPISKNRCFKESPSEKVLSSDHAVSCWEVD
jgi:oligopeptide/dipeptide ABC transporter ATP-binding protein